MIKLECSKNNLNKKRQTKKTYVVRWKVHHEAQLISTFNVQKKRMKIVKALENGGAPVEI